MAGSVLTTPITSSNSVSGSRAISKSRMATVGSVGSCAEDQILLGSIKFPLPTPARPTEDRTSSKMPCEYTSRRGGREVGRKRVSEWAGGDVPDLRRMASFPAGRAAERIPAFRRDEPAGSLHTCAPHRRPDRRPRNNARRQPSGSATFFIDAANSISRRKSRCQSCQPTRMARPLPVSSAAVWSTRRILLVAVTEKVGNLCPLQRTESARRLGRPVRERARSAVPRRTRERERHPRLLR